MQVNKMVSLIGYASSVGGTKPGSANGPLVIQKSTFFSELAQQGLQFEWLQMLQSDSLSQAPKLTQVTKLTNELAAVVKEAIEQNKFFMVMGGDHTSAIGTWSGAAEAKKSQGPVGLIWIDAHMDSHTPQTSETGNLHGMPLACLLGHGESSLAKKILGASALRPENVSIIGARSFEKGEEELLNSLKVRVFYMDEVKQRGMAAVLADAINIANNGTVGYGISLDIDSMDPIDAPGTGVPVPNGIPANELCAALQVIANDTRLIGLEIVEFDPQLDVNQRTERIIPKLISAAILGK